MVRLYPTEDSMTWRQRWCLLGLNTGAPQLRVCRFLMELCKFLTLEEEYGSLRIHNEGAGEMALGMRCLSHNHEDLNLDPQCLYKKLSLAL